MNMNKFDIINTIKNTIAVSDDIVTMRQCLLDLLLDLQTATVQNTMPVQLTSADLNTNRIGAIKFVKTLINGTDDNGVKRIALQYVDENGENAPYNGNDVQAYYGLKASKDLVDIFVEYLVTNYNNK